MKNNPDTWYTAFLQRAILPHSIFYGYLIEWIELAIALTLLGGALVLVSRTRRSGDVWYGFALTCSLAVAIAAGVGAFLTVNFHFWTGGWIFPVFRPAAAGGEGIDLDGLLPPLSLVVVIANIALFRELLREGVFQRDLQPASTPGGVEGRVTGV